MIGQLLLIRVLVVVFFGNELTFGIIIAGWLLAEAAGSHFGGWLTRAGTAASSLFVPFLAGYALLLPAAILLARFLGSDGFDLVPGQGMGLGHATLTTALAIGPASFVHGALFPLSAQILGESKGGASVSRAYLIETAGAIGGALIFVFILAVRFTELGIAVGLLILHLLLVAWLVQVLGGARLLSRAAAVSAIVVAALSVTALQPLHRLSLAGLFPEGRVVVFVNSPYGNITVVERESQHTVFYDGRPIIALPDPDTARLQDYAWLAALAHPKPDRVLVLGGGLGGLLSFLLEHPVETLVYTELDPYLVDILDELNSPLVRRELSGPRTEVVPMDGRLYLSRSRRSYDLVILGHVDVQSLQTNRYYTREMFQLIQRRLEPGGVVAMSLPGSTIYLGKELAELNACLFATAGSVFTHVELIPGDQNIILASDTPLDLEFERIVHRLRQRGLYGEMFTSGYLAYRLDPLPRAEFTSLIEQTHTRLNRDFFPVGFFYGLRYWGTAFAPGALDPFTQRRSLGVAAVLGLVLLALGARAVVRSPGARANRLTFTIGTSGVAAMAADVFTLFAFQSLFGYIYQLTGLFMAAFMGGMFLGGVLAYRHCSRRHRAISSRLLLGLDVSVAALLLGFLPLVLLLRNLMGLPGAPVFGAMTAVAYALLAGAAVGAQFPVAAALMPAGWQRSAGSIAGRLYTADLVGGFAGGIAITLLLFPLLGLAYTLLVLAVLKTLSATLLLRLPA